MPPTTKPSTNGHSTNGQVKGTKEHHEPKFRGTWTPAEIHYLLYERTITTTEYVLLDIINSLVDAKGDGCWASNAYLADRIGMTEQHVKNMIGRLKKIGLLTHVGWKQVGEKQFRVLETAWSRVSVDGGTGTFKSTPRGTFKSTQSPSPTEKEIERRGEIGGTPLRGSPPPPQNGNFDEENRTNGNAAKRNGTAPINRTKESSFPFGKVRPRKKVGPPSIYQELADRLVKLIEVQSNITMTKTASWPNILRKECRERFKNDPSRLDRILTHVEKEWDNPRRRIPKITSANHFIGVAVWIQEDMAKDENDKTRKKLIARDNNRLTDDEIA